MGIDTRTAVQLSRLESPTEKFAIQSCKARIRGIEHHQLLSLQPSLRPTAHEYRSFLCLLKTAEARLRVAFQVWPPEGHND